MYEKKVSTANPGLIVSVLDGSGSTQDHLAGTTDAVATWIERFDGIILMELLTRSTAMQGEQATIKPRYYNTFVLYGSEPHIWGEDIMDIETTVRKYKDSNHSFGLGSLGRTDTKAAFEKAYSILQNAVNDDRFKESFPPMLFHLTDGLSDTDAGPVAEKIKQLSTSDGNVLVVNAFIGTETNLSYRGPEDFPGYTSEDEAGPSDDNIRLYNMSSEMPETIYQNLVSDGIFPALRQNARLFFDVRTKEMLKHVIQVVGSIGSRADRTER
ncbi:MAG: vWA domain-containing protein [Anaerohalosphaeraceae bacterium]